MPVLKDDYRKVEKINGIIYDMSPSGGFMHSQVNGNLYYKNLFENPLIRWTVHKCTFL